MSYIVIVAVIIAVRLMVQLYFINKQCKISCDMYNKRIDSISKETSDMTYITRSVDEYEISTTFGNVYTYNVPLGGY